MRVFKDHPEVKNSAVGESEGMLFTYRQLSLMLSGIIIGAFLCFMTGYFLGQKKFLEQFSTKLEQDSLSDKIYSSLYALYDNKGAPEADGDAAELEEVQTSMQEQKLAQESVPETAPVPDVAAVAQEPIKKYYAQLVGFSTADAAYACAQRINKNGKHGTLVMVKKHSSVSPKKKFTRHWYQIVTKPFESKESLLASVEPIKHQERLKDIKILSC